MARTQHGLPGIYNSSPFTLLTGEGSALSVDANGNLLISGSGTGGGTAGTGSIIVGGVYNTSLPTYTNGQQTQAQTDANGRIFTADNKAEDVGHVSGDVGSFSLGVRNDTPTALAGTTLDYIPLTTDANGGMWESLATLIAGENLTTNRLNNEPIYSFQNITTNATTTVKSGAGTFHGFTINNNGFTTAGTITIYDNTAGSGTKIGTWTIPIMPPGTALLATTFFPPTLQLDASFATGLTFVTATTAPAADITVLYR